MVEASPATGRWRRILRRVPLAIVLISLALMIIQLMAAPKVTRVLVLCMDRTVHTDMMMVMEIDKSTHKTTVMRIPRDTLSLISPQLGLEKINMAAFEVGVDRTCEIVGDVLGHRIDHYIVVRMTDFINLIDLMGGIKVTAPKHVIGAAKGVAADFLVDVSKAPVAPNAPKEEMETAVLTGEQALRFVQWRPGADVDRSGRQDSFIDQLVRNRKRPSISQLAQMASWAWHLDTNMSPLQAARIAMTAMKGKREWQILDTKPMFLNARSYVLPPAR